MKNRTLDLGAMCFSVWLVLFTSHSAHAELSIGLAIVPPTEMVRQTGEVNGRSEVRIEMAKGEYESFQVVVTAIDGNLDEVQAGLSEIRDAGGHLFPKDSITWYREAFVPVRHPSPKAQIPPGLLPDPLVPFFDPYTGEPIRQPRWRGNRLDGARFGGAKFSLWAGYHQPLWVDVFAPRDLPAGVYRGEIRVWARSIDPVTMPIEIKVWDFKLPEGPTHENHFGGVSRIASYYHLKSSSPELRVLEDRYSAMLADHRINPSIPSRLLPKPRDDGTVTLSGDLEKELDHFVKRYHITDFQVPSAPYRDPFGKDRNKVLNFYRSWYQFLERKGWSERAYLYMRDEPNDATAYASVREMGALVTEAESRLRKLVVEQPYPQDPTWPDLTEAVDIWCPLFGFIDEESVQEAMGRGDEVWSYTALTQTAPPYHPHFEEVKNDHPPFWEIDFPAIQYRLAPWLNRRYGITGLLYWSTVYWGSPDRNPWDDPGFRIRWNGEGFLMYPGIDAGVEGPIASIRLKNLRDGMEDYEYFALLSKLGGEEKVRKIVKEQVPTWGSFNQDSEKLFMSRRHLAESILEAKRSHERGSNEVGE